jgi:ketosteroid isomerase-like protein
MSTTTSADVVLRYYAALNARDWAAYDQLIAADCESCWRPDRSP